MPANTPILSLPYPIPADSVDVPRDIQALATALDTTLGAGGSVYASKPVLDVGLLNQIRAGRQLTVADFTAMGLATPVGLFNLSGLTNLGSGGALINKGTVPFGVGVNGLASTAAQFAGSTAQALYIADTGAADPFRIKTGSWGCWFRTAKRGTIQALVSKWGTAQQVFYIRIDVANAMTGYVSLTGSDAQSVTGVSDVCDDRWHFGCITHDGTMMRLYLDGVLEGAANTPGPIFSGSGPLNIGASAADGGAAASNPHYGRVDEAFVTADVLTEDQIRNLYCVKVAHGLPAAPTKVSLNVRRRRRGGELVVGDFPVSPIRLHNFTGGALTDAGTGGVTLTANGAPVSVAGADGALGGGYNFVAASTQSLTATDAGLPAGTAARSYGVWFKTATAAIAGVVGWGTPLTAMEQVNLAASGVIAANNGADSVLGPFVADGQWHFAVVVADNAAGDGVRRKLYLDGRLVGGSTVLNTVTLTGAGAFKVGALPGGTSPFTGQIDGVFVTGSALTFEQVAALYSKGSQALAASPKNAGDHVEAVDATSVLAEFSTLDSTAQIDLGVS